MLYHIVAMAQNRVIGKEGRLPWHFSSDSKHFKQTTMGSTIIMGRKTFESIGKKALPGRENFVLSRSHQKSASGPTGLRPGGENGARFFTSLENALNAAQTDNIFIIGGETLFKETMNRVNGIYLTQIHAKYEGDVFYPEIPKEFKEKTRKNLQDNPKLELIYYEK